MLAKLYRSLNKSSKRFEIIYASNDKDESEYREYWESMPWLSIPFKHSIAEALSAKYMVMGIPSLVLVNPKTGETITTAGTTVINSDPEGSYIYLYCSCCFLKKIFSLVVTILLTNAHTLHARYKVPLA